MSIERQRIAKAAVILGIDYDVLDNALNDARHKAKEQPEERRAELLYTMLLDPLRSQPEGKWFSLSMDIGRFGGNLEFSHFLIAEKKTIQTQQPDEESKAQKQLGQDIYDEIFDAWLTKLVGDQSVQAHCQRLADKIMKHVAYHTRPSERELSADERVNALILMAEKIKANADEYSKSMSQFRADRFAQVALAALLERFELRRRS